jgi:hypothetical protein
MKRVRAFILLLLLIVSNSSFAQQKGLFVGLNLDMISQNFVLEDTVWTTLASGQRNVNSSKLRVGINVLYKPFEHFGIFTNISYNKAEVDYKLERYWLHYLFWTPVSRELYSRTIESNFNTITFNPGIQWVLNKGRVNCYINQSFQLEMGVKCQTIITDVYSLYAQDTTYPYYWNKTGIETYRTESSDKIRISSFQARLGLQHIIDPSFMCDLSVFVSYGNAKTDRLPVKQAITTGMTVAFFTRLYPNEKKEVDK